jgi:hypothetical protein
MVGMISAQAQHLAGAFQVALWGVETQVVFVDPPSHLAGAQFLKALYQGFGFLQVKLYFQFLH